MTLQFGKSSQFRTWHFLEARTKKCEIFCCFLGYEKTRLFAFEFYWPVTVYLLWSRTFYRCYSFSMILFATDRMATFENECFFLLDSIDFSRGNASFFISHCMKSALSPTGIPVVILHKFLVNSDAVYSFDKPGKLVEKRMVMVYCFWHFSTFPIGILQ